MSLTRLLNTEEAPEIKILLRRCFVLYLYSRQYMYKGYQATDILIMFICANVREPKLKSINEA